MVLTETCVCDSCARHCNIKVRSFQINNVEELIRISFIFRWIKYFKFDCAKLIVHFYQRKKLFQTGACLMESISVGEELPLNMYTKICSSRASTPITKLFSGDTILI